MPYRDDPHDAVSLPIEEAVRAYDHLTIGEIRELGHDAAGLRKALQPAKGLLGSGAEPLGSGGTIAANVLDRCEKLDASSRGEPDSHGLSRARIASASASTSSRS